MPRPYATTQAHALPERADVPDAEAMLIEGLRRRDPQAVGLAYDLHHRAVRAFSRRLVADEAAAEDLVQDVFVALPAAARRFKASSSLRTFLIGITVNQARHHVRAAARRRRALARLADERPAETVPLDEATHRRRLADALVHALDELSLKQRVVFLLCDVENRSAPEVAALLDVPEATVRTRLHHARERLRARLAEGGEP
jgi:RNA polymerase sigma-70 factor (ECF subfamily)